MSQVVQEFLGYSSPRVRELEETGVIGSARTRGPRVGYHTEPGPFRPEAISFKGWPRPPQPPAGGFGYHVRDMNWNIAPGSRRFPLIIAHRGDSTAAPENTLGAFLRAVEVGADGVELDVRLTKDQKVAVMHDRYVDRTTDGKGPVGTFTLSGLKKLDAGSWFDPRFKAARVPTLDEVFEEMPPAFLVNVELKVRGFGVIPLVSRVVEILRRHDRFEGTLVASFNPVALGVLRVLEPRALRGYIWSKRHPLPLRARWLSPLARPHWMDPDHATFTPQLLKRFHRQGKPVLAWESDSGDELGQLLGQGVDGLVTSSPEELVQQRS